MEIDIDELRLHVYPAPILKKVSEPFETPLPENIKAIGDKMVELMYQEGGIGLAANQAGFDRRMIVYDLSDDRNDPHILINPEIVSCSKDKVDSDEGCLSFPEIQGVVKRNASVTVKGLNTSGEEVSVEASELMAAMFQHEIDHLNGITFVDRLGMTSKMMIRSELKALEEDYQVS